MKYLLKAIKTTVGATTALSTLVNRVFVGQVGEKVKVTDGPYARLALIGNTSEYGFSDTLGYDQSRVQFSVFADTLTGADGLIDQLIIAFNAVSLTLESGGTAAGLKINRGIQSEPRAPDKTQTYHCWCVIEFTYSDVLS